MNFPNFTNYSQTYYPLVIFTYNRLRTIVPVLESVLANPEARNTTLILYSDGPRDVEDVSKVEEVRTYLQTIKGFKDIKFRFRKLNYGLAKSFISGITEVLAEYEAAIFLEDDNLVSKRFLAFMNEGLNYYKGNERVSCICGYSYPLFPKPRGPYFVRGADTWSVAIWRSSWKNFSEDSVSLKKQLQEVNAFSPWKHCGFNFPEMLNQQILGNIDSWGVRWWISAYLSQSHVLYPPVPLCVSIGFGEDSIHCKGYWNPIYRKASDLSDSYRFQPASHPVQETVTTRLTFIWMNFWGLKLYRYIQYLGRIMRVKRL
jgi:hypothetical protein